MGRQPWRGGKDPTWGPAARSTRTLWRWVPALKLMTGSSRTAKSAIIGSPKRAPTAGTAPIAQSGVSAAAVALAWTYVVLRIAHSVVQATTNRISIRFPLFLTSTLALLGLTILALLRTLG